jgi:hypothetical protein
MGASIVVAFAGTGITWIGYRCPCAGGTARVYLDGTLQATVNTYAAGSDAQREVFSVGGLADTNHVLTIVVTDERNSAGDTAHVVVDAFDIDDGEAELIEDSDPSISYSGTWVDVADPNASGGSMRTSQEFRATASVTFNGTGIEWIGYRCTCTAGIASVNLVGRGLLATKHTYARNREPQATIYRIDGLPPGEHKLWVEVTGDSITDNAWVAIDAFRVLNENSSSGGAETTPPTVSMTSPVQDELVTGTVSLRAAAADNVGVTKVQFFAEPGILLGEDSTAPYSITRDTSHIGNGRSFLLWARAIDAAGNVGTSSFTRATVQHEGRVRGPAVNITELAVGTVSGTEERQ